MDMDSTQIRKDTIGCENVIHFNNAGASLMPAPVTRAIRDYINLEEHIGGYEAENAHQQQIAGFYHTAAQLLHCQPHQIAFTNSATDSYNRALSAIPFQQGDVVLLTGNDYPSNYLALLSLQKRYGIQIIQVNDSADGEIDLVDLKEKLEQLQPRLLSVSHIPTSSGLVQPLEQIAEIVGQFDTIYILDACQSFGQIDIDAIATNAHFISGTFRKFLRGPRGAGLLFVSEKALAAGLEPLFIDLSGAEWIAVDQYTARPDAKRFEDFETSYALMMGATASMKYLFKIGISNIIRRNKELLSYLVDQLKQLPEIHLQDRGLVKCNIVTFHIKGAHPMKLKQYLHQEGINISTTSISSARIDFREKGIDWVARISPHYYNTETEIDTFIAKLRQFKN